MDDQANLLRQLVRQEAEGRHAEPGTSRLVIVTAGKGGVGTTTIAANLAVALAGTGRTCVLVDGNPDRADATTLCGLDAEFGISHVVAGWRNVEETLLEGAGEIRVLPGVWDSEQPSPWTEAAQGRLIEELRHLGGKAQFVVVDAGSGLGPVVGRFWRAADLVLVATSPEPMSIMDAYASIKVHSEGASASIRTVVNRAADAANADEVHARLARACHRFLALSIHDAGYLPSVHTDDSSSIEEGLFVLRNPESVAARCVGRMAQSMIGPESSNMQRPAPRVVEPLATMS